MPINARPEYFKAESEFLSAQGVEEKIACLEKMISLAPKHKSSERLIANLKARLAKLKKEKEGKKKKKHSRGIKKEGHAQVIMLGKANSGKSSLLNLLTAAKPQIAEWLFTTQKPAIGTLDMGGCKIQIVEMPANANNELLSAIHAADLLILVVASLNELVKLSDMLKDMQCKIKRFVVINKVDIIDKEIVNQLTKLKNTIAVSAQTKEGITKLKETIFQSLDLIRVYTKEPGKKINKQDEPVILKKGSTISDLAKKIRKDFLLRFLFARVWGSARWQGQSCGLNHMLEDKDVVELHLR